MKNIMKGVIAVAACGTMFLLSGCEAVKPASNETTFRPSSPIAVALEAMGKSFQSEVTNLSVTQRVSGGESPNSAVVTVEESGLLDDSVAAERRVFSLTKKNEQWEITHQVKTHQCRLDRGHQDFSNQPCE